MGREGLDLSAKKREAAKQKKAASSEAAETSSKADEDFDEDEGEDILSSVPQRGQNKNNMLYIVIGIIVVVLVVLVFLLLRGGRSSDADVQQPPVQTEQIAPPTQSVRPEQGDSSGLPAGVGTQDFTQNTTMTNSDVLTNPDQYVQDLYGLSTRVDYTVDKISYVADFVSYTKHRGTWGGGLELYWLDAEYKGNQYVVQVPFKYYKELDDAGIVPVKMEVLSIQGSAQGEMLTVISYMSLDEEVLKDILKNQGKSK